MQYDVKPGTFEPISNVSIGVFTLNVVSSFKLDGNYPFILSDVIVKQGSTIISASNYTLSMDTAATTQEAGQSGKTLYGAIKITNAAYAGVELNVSGNNFGTYVSNQGTFDFVTEQIATRVEAVGTNISAGELAVFSGTEGDIKSDNTGAIAQWDAGTIYNVAGTLVRREGVTYVATGQATNQGIDPADPNNALYWYEPEDVKTLKRWANRAKVVSGDFHTVHDRASANYQQRLRIGKTQVNGANKEFYLIHLDGSTVTGNAPLTALLTGNPYLDIIAPDVGGIRTLIDMASRHIAPQSSGGDNPTIGAKLEDRFQGHWHEITKSSSVPDAGETRINTTTGSTTRNGLFHVQNPIADTANGTPRTGSTTRPKELTVGASYIVVMVGA